MTQAQQDLQHDALQDLVTLIEIRMSRDTLKSFGISSVADLKKSERGMIELQTTVWLRILAQPKVRGCEKTAALHPIWERIRNLLFAYFTGNEVDVKYKKPESLVCDPEALEKQALVCLSKALAVRHGEQSDTKSSEVLANVWIADVARDLHAKLNTCAVLRAADSETLIIENRNILSNITEIFA